ncbi:MAG: FAD-binding protein [Coriobacteriales bacterium]|nr:FAD-binding protein [Coriobacteriales bacterium]
MAQAKTGISRRKFVKASMAAGTIVTGMSRKKALASDAPQAQSFEGFKAPSTEDGLLSVRPGHGEGNPRTPGFARAEATPIAPVEPPKAWDKEADVVVVGTGMGGLAAIINCAEGGLSVIGLEKDSRTGGSGRHAYYNLCYVGGTDEQNSLKAGYPIAVFKPNNAGQCREVAREFNKHYQYSANLKLLERVAQCGPKYIDWLRNEPNSQVHLHDFGGRKACAWTNAEHDEHGYNAAMGNSTLVDRLTQNAADAGAQILTSTECTALARDADGRIVGVRAEDDNGIIYIKAKRGVLLAAGGFGFNLDLLEQYIPTAYLCATSGGPVPSHTGEAFRMGLGVGADFAGFNSFVCWDSGADTYWNGQGAYCSDFWSSVHQLTYMPIVKFNKLGERVAHFGVGASDAASMRSDEYYATNYDPNMAQSWACPDYRKYMVWDSTWDFETVNNLEGTAATKYSPALTWKYFSPIALETRAQTWEEDFQNYIDSGLIKVANTIEELGEMWGFEPGVLEGAVERWNADCEAGKDTESVIPYAAEALVPIKEPPFYGMCMGAQISKTNCGLRVTNRMEVVDNTPQHNIIPGLYASWSTAGGFTGESMFLDFGQVSPMGSVALSGTTGYIASLAILGELE